MITKTILKTNSETNFKFKHYILVNNEAIVIYKLTLIKFNEYNNNFISFIPVKYFKDLVLMVQIIAIKKSTLKLVNDIVEFPYIHNNLKIINYV